MRATRSRALPASRRNERTATSAPERRDGPELDPAMRTPGRAPRFPRVERRAVCVLCCNEGGWRRSVTRALIANAAREGWHSDP